MDTSNQHPMAQPGLQPSFGDKLRRSKALIPTLAVMAVAVAALATTLVVTTTNARDGQNDLPEMTSVVPAPAPVTAPARAPVVARAPVTAPAPAVVAPRPPVQVAQVCQNCGVVESSVAVQRQGQVNGIGNTEIGLGTVAGGVIGGLLGNQVGGGSGKTAATVLGAAGGAYAGNRVEKNMKKVTVYQMRVRMNDGSYRTIEQSSAVATGSRVVVEGNSLRVTG